MTLRDRTSAHITRIHTLSVDDRGGCGAHTETLTSILAIEPLLSPLPLFHPELGARLEDMLMLNEHPFPPVVVLRLEQDAWSMVK